ncbi:MAG: hypothetical protein IDH49_13580 [Gammaproteobacteria bacterium]|nr:hypothetical protein [Gammaproteobacteria bacterium]
MISAHICNTGSRSAAWRCRNELRLLWFTYLLHALVLPAWIGALVNFFKLNGFQHVGQQEMRDYRVSMPILASHHQWLLHTTIAATFMMMVALGTLYSGAGYAIGVGTALWWVYRIIRGVWALVKQESLPVLWKR